MGHNTNNIKKFGEFMPKKRKWKMLNKLLIKGTIKGGFFKKNKDFELVIYFSGLKKLIFDIQSDDVNVKDPKSGIDFGIGDHIDKAKEWIEKNGHEIDVEIDRFKY